MFANSRANPLRCALAIGALAASLQLTGGAAYAAEEKPIQVKVSGWALKGSLTPQKLGQTIALPAGCAFGAEVEIPGSMVGSSSCPPWAASVKLFGYLPANLGLTLRQTSPITASITKTESGAFALKGATAESVTVSSIALMGLTIPTNCSTSQSVELPLEATESSKELLERASFSGKVTLPSFTCKGGLLGSSFGWVLTTLLSGPGNSFALSAEGPSSASTVSANERGEPGAPPSKDPFYNYEGSAPLSGIAPGTVLKTRTEPLHIAGLALPVAVVQLLYRTVNELGEPAVNVTSVVEPPLRFGTPNVLSYQSFYDALSTEADPSYSISGGPIGLDTAIPTLETVLIAPALLAGEAVVIPDTEGENADFAAGPEYGHTTLDSLRAALSSQATGLAGTHKIAMLGYSGGAIATGWAAEQAPSYAPEINSLLVGAAMGGVLVDPAHNLKYVEGSKEWAGVMPMALIGLSRAYHVNLSPYLSAYGEEVFGKLKNASIAEALGAYPGLTFAQLAKPEFSDPESIKIYDEIANQVIMGSTGAPSTPMFIGQGNGGELEGTPGNKPGIGPGDGVMIAGDVRSMSRQFCAGGDRVQFKEYNGLSHVLAALAFLPEAASYIANRFGGGEAPENCASIAPGNSLAPIPVP